MESNDYLDRSAEAAVDALAGELAGRLAAPTDALFGRQLERIDSLLARSDGSDNGAELRRLAAAMRASQQSLRRTTLAAVHSLPGRLRREFSAEITRQRASAQTVLDRYAEEAAARSGELYRSQTDLAERIDAQDERLAQIAQELAVQLDAWRTQIDERLGSLEEKLADWEATASQSRNELAAFRSELMTTLTDWSDRFGDYIDSLAPRLGKQQETHTRETLLPEIERLIKAQNQDEGKTQAALAELRATVVAGEKRTKQAFVAAVIAALAAAGALIAALVG